MKCALPVTVPDGDTPIEVYFGAIEACLTTPADRVTWALCNPNAGSAMTPDANDQLSYLVASPVLTMGIVQEVRACESDAGML